MLKSQECSESFGNITCPPDKSSTPNLPSAMAFIPIFHHFSLSSIVLSSTVDTQLSGTGSIAAAGSPEKEQILSDTKL